MPWMRAFVVNRKYTMKTITQSRIVRFQKSHE